MAEGGGSGERPVEPVEQPVEQPDTGKQIGRRVVLSVLALGAVGVVTGSTISDTLAKLAQHDPTGLLNILPFGDNFRYYSVTGSVPVANPATYRLGVTGLVDTEQHYSLTDLAALPQTDITADFQCVTGWRVPDVHWTGVRLLDLLNAAGVQTGGKALRFESFDGLYTESLTLAEAYGSDVMVAYELGGKPLSREHGGPARLYVAPMYGYKSIKWLSHVEVVDRVEPGYWETVGNYDVEAWVGRSNGRNDPAT